MEIIPTAAAAAHIVQHVHGLLVQAVVDIIGRRPELHIRLIITGGSILMVLPPGAVRTGRVPAVAGIAAGSPLLLL